MVTEKRMNNQNFLVVIDRDGVINEDYGYVGRISEFVWIEEVFPLLLGLQKDGAVLYVATNQSGIGRGYYSRLGFLTLTHWMKTVLKRKGIVIQDVKFCPHLPSESGRPLCYCRKPAPGMLVDILRESGLPAETAVMVGDKDSDYRAALAAGFSWFVPVANRGQRFGNFIKIT